MMYYRNDEQSKSVYYLLTILKVLSLIAYGLAYDDNRWNDINQITNISKSEFDRNDMSNDEKIGLFVFTQYCGPGDRVWKAISGYGKLPSSNMYADLDVCCKRHDECPNYITDDSDYERYIGLPRRPQIFSRLNKNEKKN